MVDLALALTGLALEAVQATLLVSLRLPSLLVDLLPSRSSAVVLASACLSAAAVLPSVLRGRLVASVGFATSLGQCVASAVLTVVELQGWLAASVSLAASLGQGTSAVTLAPVLRLIVARKGGCAGGCARQIRFIRSPGSPDSLFGVSALAGPGL